MIFINPMQAPNPQKLNNLMSRHQDRSSVQHVDLPLAVQSFKPIFWMLAYNLDIICKAYNCDCGQQTGIYWRILMHQQSMWRMAYLFSTEIGQQQHNMRRFYKQATVAPNPAQKHPLHHHLLLLDGKTVKTPYHHPLAFPTHALAFLVVNQFNRQQKYLKTGEMPLLALTRTAVDADIEGHLAQHLRATIYEYLKTDTLLFVDDRYDTQHKQLAAPVLQFFTSKFGINLKPSNSIQPPEVQINERFVQWVESLSNWQLIGFQTMTIWMKSTVSAFAVAESKLNPVEIQRASYLQEDAQMRSSGEVEEKLMDINQIRLMVSCGEMMYKLSKVGPEHAL